MRLFDAETTRAALPFSRLIPALRERFISGCEVPLRHVHQVHQVPAAQGTSGEPVTSLLMPAWQPGWHYGVKIVNIAPGNTARGLTGLHSSDLLHDAATGVPLALIDGDQITARRTNWLRRWPAPTSSAAPCWPPRRWCWAAGCGRAATST